MVHKDKNWRLLLHTNRYHSCNLRMLKQFLCDNTVCINSIHMQYCYETIDLGDVSNRLDLIVKNNHFHVKKVLVQIDYMNYRQFLYKSFRCVLRKKLLLENSLKGAFFVRKFELVIHLFKSVF